MWHTSELALLCDLGYAKTLALIRIPCPKTSVINFGTKQDTVRYQQADGISLFGSSFFFFKLLLPFFTDRPVCQFSVCPYSETLRSQNMLTKCMTIIQTLKWILTMIASHQNGKAKSK